MCSGNCTQGRRCTCAANDPRPANAARPDFLEPLHPRELAAVLSAAVLGAIVMCAGAYTIGVWLIERISM